MNINFMRKIDKIAGLGIIRILSILRGKRSMPAAKDVKHILIIKLFGFGNFIFLSPAIHNLKRIYPDAKIDVLTFEQNRDICGLYTDIDETKTIRFSTLKMGRDIIGFAAKNLSKYDLCLDFEQFVRLSAIIGLSLNPKFFIGISTENSGKRKAFDLPIRYSEKDHIVKEYYDVIMSIDRYYIKEGKNFIGHKDLKSKVSNISCEGYMAIDTVPVLIAPKMKSSSRTRKLLSENSEKVLIGICIGGRSDDIERRYPEDKVVELLKKISRIKDARILFFGSPSERADIDEVIKDSGIRIGINCAGMSLSDSAMMISKTRLFISNDTGPIHLAASLGIFCIGLYGPSKEWIYGPYTSKKIILRDEKHPPVRSNHNEKNAGWNEEWWPEPAVVYDKIQGVLKSRKK